MNSVWNHNLLQVKKMNLLFVCILLSMTVAGQRPDTLSFPEEGKPMPAFTLRHIKYFPKAYATVDDFKGKWLLLEFWSINCGACVAGFPYVNKIQQQLGDRVQVMLVGIQDAQDLIQPMYAKFKEREHLVMPCAFDSAVANRFDIGLVPHSILIDDKGIVRCVTTSFSVQDVEGFLEGHPPVMPKTYRRMQDDSSPADDRRPFDPAIPYLVNANGSNESDFVFRTIFSHWNGARQQVYRPTSITQDIEKGQFQALGVPLEWLFNYAHFGRGGWNYLDTIVDKIYPHPILKLRDSSRFNYSFRYNRNLYACSISVPKEQVSEEYIKTVLQKELSLFLGVESIVETRNIPVWVLQADTSAADRLRTRGGPEQGREVLPHVGLIVKKFPFSRLVDWIKRNQWPKLIFDDTGISGNIDVSLDCVPTDFDDLNRALKKNGLHLVPSTKPMKVVVIRDKKERAF
jgi:thiol-disulfide isomerase/thioredoxin